MNMNYTFVFGVDYKFTDDAKAGSFKKNSIIYSI